MSEALRVYAKGAALGLRPDPILPVSQWADQAIYMPSEVTPFPGPWRTDKVPFMREILDALGPTDPCQEIVFQKSSQVASTATMVAAICHVAARSPGPSMVLQPTVDLGRAFSLTKLAPVVRASPALSSVFADQKSRDGAATTMHKTFPGGFLLISGANSAASLRMHSIRWLFLDEVDAYPEDVDGEGDPVELAIKRTTAFHNKKIFKGSSPTTEESSRIAPAYQAGTRARFHVPCPHCGFRQPLDWDNLDFTRRGSIEAPVYPCVKCDGAMENRHKAEMLAGGTWVHAVEWKPGLAKSYQISELYSPFTSWAKMVAGFLAAKTSQEKLKVWINTSLGEVWRERGEAPDHVRLHERRDSYHIGRAPRGVLFVTCGVDVQENRLECEVVGWGEGERSWSIDYHVLAGRPAETEVWALLDKILRQPIPAEQGDAFEIAQTCVDSGYLSPHVYQFARSRKGVAATKGTGNPAAPIIGKPSVIDFTHQGRTVKSGVQLWTVGTHQAKLQVYERLRLTKDDADDTPPGYCHFPTDYDQHYFQMLTAETLITRTVKGYAQQRWEKTGRNEGLDTRVLAVAAFHILGAHRLRPEDWRQMAANRGLIPARQPDLIEQPLPELIRAPQAPAARAPAAASYVPEVRDWF